MNLLKQIRFHTAAGYLSERLSASQNQRPAALILAEDVGAEKFVLICGSYGSVGLTPEIYSEIKLLHYTHATRLSIDYPGRSCALNAI